MRKDLFISVDIEADGPYPIDYSMLSVGACTELNGQQYTFYAELKPISPHYVAKALEVCERGGLNRNELMTNGVDPKQAMAELTEWVLDLCRNEYRPVFVGFNAGFDWMFVNTYMCRYLGVNVFGINAFDTKSFYMGKYDRKMWAHTTKKNIPKKFFGTQQHTHNALSDAIEQYELFRNIFTGVK